MKKILITNWIRKQLFLLEDRVIIRGNMVYGAHLIVLPLMIHLGEMRKAVINAANDFISSPRDVPDNLKRLNNVRG
jgi:hypothetical protein